MIEKKLIDGINNFLAENYCVESYERIGERVKDLTLFERTEIFFRKITGSFDGYFLWYLSKLMKEKNFTEEQLTEKACLNENCFYQIRKIIKKRQNLTEEERIKNAFSNKDIFSLFRDIYYVKIPKESVWAVSLALQLNLQKTYRLLDLSLNFYLYFDNKRDLIVAYFIENKIDNVPLLNETLKYYNLRDLEGEKDFPPECEEFIELIIDYIEGNYVPPEKYSVSGEIHEEKVSTILKNHVQNFGDYLREFIKQKNLSEVEVYKSAHLDRRTFSKLRNDKNYKPSKNTILAVAFGMKLNLEETENLLKAGGYALSEYSQFDLIIKYFHENEIYDLFLINEVLDYYHFKPICS